jgi:hypothetical protein
MEPLDENELNQLLRKWEGPPAPPALKQRVLATRRSKWRWLFTGSIRVPVPVLLALVLLVALWVHYSKPRVNPTVAKPATVSLADFQPVRQLDPVLVGGAKK